MIAEPERGRRLCTSSNSLRVAWRVTRSRPRESALTRTGLATPFDDARSLVVLGPLRRAARRSGSVADRAVVDLSHSSGTEQRQDLSPETVMRDWKTAKAWLLRELRRGHSTAPSQGRTRRNKREFRGRYERRNDFTGGVLRPRERRDDQGCRASPSLMTLPFLCAERGGTPSGSWRDRRWRGARSARRAIPSADTGP